MRKRDKYDEAIEYFNTNDNLDGIVNAWNFPEVSGPGCLFQYCGDHSTTITPSKDPKDSYGCLTMIRKGNNYVAYTPKLTKAIRADKRIPKEPEDIELKHLPVFAEWQRKLDRYKFRT